jgi:hypothetical protein
MAAILLGYFSTMVATLVGLMMFLNAVLSSGIFQPAHRRPFPDPVIAQAAVADGKQVAAPEQLGPSSAPVVFDKVSAPSQAAAVAPARSATARQAMPDRSQRQKLAADQTRKEDSAGRQQDREYSLALGYARQAQGQAGSLFDPAGPRHF